MVWYLYLSIDLRRAVSIGKLCNIPLNRQPGALAG